MPDVRPPTRGLVPAGPLVPDRNASPAATSATRSTEERAFARTSFRRPRPSATNATGKLPLPGRRTRSPQTDSRAPHLGRHHCRSGCFTPSHLLLTFRLVAPSGSLASLITRAEATAFLRWGTADRSRSTSRSAHPEGFRSSQASTVSTVRRPHSHNRRRSNPGVQRTRFARR